MARNVLKIILFSLFLSVVSCDISPTYKRKDLASTIKTIFKEEFKTELKAWLVGDSIWMYAPFEQLLDENNSKLSLKANKTLSHMFLVLKRIVLSIDHKPKFYAIILSDIKEIGADVYYVGQVQDIIKLEHYAISLGQLQEREVLLDLVNPEAIGDREGQHISPHDIKMGDFISYLVRQGMDQVFNQPSLKDYFKIEDLKASFKDGRLVLDFEIMTLKDGQDLPEPFNEAKRIVKKFIAIYAPDSDSIVEVEISDRTTSKSRLYSRKVLMEEPI